LVEKGEGRGWGEKVTDNDVEIFQMRVKAEKHPAQKGERKILITTLV